MDNVAVVVSAHCPQGGKLIPTDSLQTNVYFSYTRVPTEPSAVARYDHIKANAKLLRSGVSFCELAEVGFENMVVCPFYPSLTGGNRIEGWIKQ